MAEPLRCTAKSKTTGKQCKNIPITGGTVCVAHGGSIPAVKAAAQRRMSALIDPAMDTLYRALYECEEWSQKVRAALGILDRAGMGPGSTLTVDTEKSDLSQLSLAELQTRARQVAERFAEDEDVPPDPDTKDGAVH
jgi:hypothetical protein